MLRRELLPVALLLLRCALAEGDADVRHCSNVDECVHSDVGGDARDEETSLALVQRALRYKLREATLGDATLNATHRAESELDRHAFKSKVAACMHGSTSLPFSLEHRSQLKVLRELGLVEETPRCRGGAQQSLLGVADGVLPGYTVAQKNKIADLIGLTWGVVACCMVSFSVYSVAMVPRKTASSKDTAKDLNLADEDSAFSYGVWYWLSLSWADNLMGRYGKTWNTVMDEQEISWKNGQDLDGPYTVFKKHWMDQVKAKGKEGASIPYALFKTVGIRSTISLVFACCFDICFSMVGMTLALEKLLTCLEKIEERRAANPDEEQSYLEPTICIVLLIFGIPMVYRSSSVLASLLDGYYTNFCASGLAAMVFEKAMEMPAGSSPPKQLNDDDDPHNNMDPNVVQLLNVDIIEAWGYLLKSVVYTLFAPFLVVVMGIMLVQRIQMAGFVGFLYVIPVMATEGVFIRININYWMQYQGFQDRRLKFLRETIMQVRTIKSLALETLAFEKLDQARRYELAFNQKCQIAGSFIQAIGSTLPWGTLLLAIYWTLRSEGSVPAWKILVLQRLMGSLLSAVGMCTNGLHKFVQIPNSFKRIQRYLCQTERPRGILKDPVQSPGQREVAVRIRGDFCFLQAQPPVLKGLNVEIFKGEAVAVVGTVASGKSAFLQTIIGELYPASGATLEAPTQESHRVAYVSQVPWIVEGTLRSNVLMGQELDQDRYFQALHASCLTPDLEILPGGDQVSIGSYGVRLSGGQRARVALARAACKEGSDLVIIDDPFASVDVPTGQHICDNLIFGPLLMERTRIVVMQPSAARLLKFDRVLLVEGGTIVENDRPEKVMASEAFMRLQTNVEQAEAAGGSPKASPQKDRWTMGAKAVAQVVEKREQDGPAQSLRSVESQDHITWATLSWWFQAAGYWNIAYFAVMVCFNRLLSLWQALTLAEWIDDKMTHEVDDTIYMWRIAYRSACQCVGIVLTMHAASRVSINAAQALHSKVIKTIVRAPIDSFHDKQPTGRLLNRLSFDMRSIDDAVPWLLNSLFGFSVGICITQTYILQVMPWQFALAAVPFYLVASFFISVYRGTTVPLVFHSKFSLSEIQDLQAVVLTCQISIRANGMLDEFMKKYNTKMSVLIRCQYLIYHICTAWVMSRIFLIFSVLTTLFAIGCLRAQVPMGTLGMVIALSMSQMGEFESMAMLFTGALTTLNSLQRLAHYFDIPQEAAHEIEGDPQVRISATFERLDLVPLEIRESPEAEVCPVTFTVCVKDGQPVLTMSSDRCSLELVRGCSLGDICPALAHIDGDFQIMSVNHCSKDAREMAEELCNPPSKVWLELWNKKYMQGMGVEFRDVSVGYGIEKNVLNNVNFCIEPRMKAGFAGKTGCGKSSTLLCIMRVLEARTGQVMIGDLDARKLGLRALRTLVGLVPQDATVFEGSWRHNIDPYSEYPDGRVWEALRCVHLISYVRALERGVESLITNDGANLSFGQKQLLSLARMVIRQPPVLLLDECTSALDPITQQTVQDTLVNEFPRSTIIAVAHRVETILGFDKICVFDQGQVAEDGAVDKVLNIPNGIFRGMVDASKH